MAQSHLLCLYNTIYTQIRIFELLELVAMNKFEAFIRSCTIMTDRVLLLNKLDFERVIVRFLLSLEDFSPKAM